MRRDTYQAQHRAQLGKHRLQSTQSSLNLQHSPLPRRLADPTPLQGNRSVVVAVGESPEEVMITGGTNRVKPAILVMYVPIVRLLPHQDARALGGARRVGIQTSLLVLYGLIVRVVIPDLQGVFDTDGSEDGRITGTNRYLNFSNDSVVVLLVPDNHPVNVSRVLKKLLGTGVDNLRVGVAVGSGVHDGERYEFWFYTLKSVKRISLSTHLKLKGTTLTYSRQLR
ncbi:hypothetical protein BC835DRAFT_1338493 [Cytidiella melzeri]|nr:hypothetical protein BC835DRAFT_1338493 [Cytidiella melzeri]